MKDYSGPLRPDFSWNMLDKKILARFGREIMLFNQVHDRAIMPIIGSQGTMKTITDVAIDEWMGASPIYNLRNRMLHNINGDGVDVIMKGFQLDIGAPHMWLKFHFDVRSHDLGYFWLTSCGAYNHVRALTKGDKESETQICVHMEDPTFDATVMAVNAAARCIPIFRPPHGKEIPAEGPCRWTVKIENDIGLVEENEVTEIVRQSRASKFEFSDTRPMQENGAASEDDGGMIDYSGEFKRDFKLEDLCKKTLQLQVKEFALDVHLLQRACYHGLEKHLGKDAISGLLSEHWAAMAPIYQTRLRKLFAIEGDDMTAILKLLQLDHHFVPEYVKIGVELVDEFHGKFWINECEAVNDGELAGMLTGLWQGNTLGLQEAIQSINPRATVKLIKASSDANAKLMYEITIDPLAEPAPISDFAGLVGINGLNEADLSEHIYQY